MTSYKRHNNIYTKCFVDQYNTEKFMIDEQPIYGSSRLGVQRYREEHALLASAYYICSPTELDPITGLPLGNFYNLQPNLTAAKDQEHIHNYLGYKYYELSNHLGNVLTVVTDRKYQVDDNGDGNADWFSPDIVSTTDYYAFGQSMPGRTWSSTTEPSYSFGFNGKTKDNELKGNDNSYDFGARLYDPRTGRWGSVDPLKARMPFESPYCFGENNPVARSLLLRIVSKLCAAKGQFQIDKTEHTKRRHLAYKLRAKVINCHKWHTLHYVISMGIVRVF